MANDLTKQTIASTYSDKIEGLLNHGHNLTETDRVLIRKYVQDAFSSGFSHGYAEGLRDKENK